MQLHSSIKGSKARVGSVGSHDFPEPPRSFFCFFVFAVFGCHTILAERRWCWVHNTHSPHNMSMLLEAVHRVNVQRVAALLARGADVNTTDAQGVTPLIIACERGKISRTRRVRR